MLQATLGLLMLRRSLLVCPRLAILHRLASSWTEQYGFQALQLFFRSCIYTFMYMHKCTYLGTCVYLYFCVYIYTWREMCNTHQSFILFCLRPPAVGLFGKIW